MEGLKGVTAAFLMLTTVPSTGSGFCNSLGSCAGNTASVGATEFVFSLWLRLGDADLTDLGETGRSSLGVEGRLPLDEGPAESVTCWTGTKHTG